MRSTKWFFPFLFCFLFLSGCGKLHQVRIEDSPQQHFRNGMTFLAWGKTSEAEREFADVLRLDPNHSMAFSALGIIASRNRHFLRARLSLSQAGALAQEPSSRAWVHCAYIVLHTEQQGPEWLSKASSEYEKATRLLPGSGDPHFLMGLALKSAHRFSEAEKQLREASDMEGYFSALAASEADMVRRIQQAAPKSEVTNRIALLSKLRRVDLAELLVHEFRLRSLAPLGMSVATPKKAPVVDMEGSEHGEDIRFVASLDLEGLRTYPDGTFRPLESVTRGELAQVLFALSEIVHLNADVIKAGKVKVVPFSDVHEDSPYREAVYTLAAWGIMGPVNERTGEFDPLGHVSGPETLDALMKFRALITTSE